MALLDWLPSKCQTKSARKQIKPTNILFFSSNCLRLASGSKHFLKYIKMVCNKDDKMLHFHFKQPFISFQIVLISYYLLLILLAIANGVNAN